jgi:hypothetical protein
MAKRVPAMMSKTTRGNPGASSSIYDEEEAISKLGEVLGRPVETVAHGTFAIYPDDMTEVETGRHTGKLRVRSEWSAVGTRTYKAPFDVGKIAKAVREMMRSNPRSNPSASSSHAAEHARKTWRMWHEKDSKHEYKRSEKTLSEEHFVPIGTAKEILYSSDKWERDGDFHDYVHDFESSPKVYIPASKVRDGEAVGAPKKTAAVLGARSNPKQLVVPELAKVKSLSYIDSEGELVEVRVGRGAIMCGSPDKKTVIILTKSGPILVRGGQMSITARGIVK